MSVTRSIVAVAAVAFAGLTTPAFAEPKPPVALASLSLPTAPAPAPAAQTIDRDAQVYCVMGTSLDSRIPKKTCRTKREWTDRGVELPFVK